MEPYKQILDDFAQRKIQPGEAIQRLGQYLKAHPIEATHVRDHLNTLRDTRKLPLPDYAKLDVELLQWEKQARASLEKPIALAERNSWRAPDQWPDGWTEEAGIECHPDQVIKKSFRLQSRLSSDTFGETWEALDLLQDGRKPAERHVAVIFLGAAFNHHPHALRSFIAQFEHFQKRNSPNVSKLFAIGREGSRVFIVTELLGGERLDLLIDKNPSGIPAPEVQTVLTGLAQAMQANLQHGGIPLIVSPAHIFYDPLQKSVKILDFGLDWLIRQCLQEATDKNVEYLYCASEAYNSCEVMLNLGQVDQRDYIYTLACIGYELLAGRHPYGRKTCPEASEKGFVPNALKTISGKQWQLLSSALAFSRDQRPHDLATFLHGLYPPKKSQGPLFALAAVVVLLVVALAGWWGMQQWRMNELRGAILQQDPAAIATLQTWDESRQVGLLHGDNGALSLAIAEHHLREHGRQALTQLALYPKRSRGLILQEPAVQNRIKAYYEAQIEAELHQDRYTEAEQLLAEFAHSFPQAMDLEVRKAKVQEAREQRVQTLAEEYRTCLGNESIPLQARTPCLEDAVTGIRGIDPDHSLLMDATLAEKYRVAIEKLLKDGVFDTANTLLADWARLSPDQDPARDSLSWLATEYVSIENLIRDDYLIKAEERIEQALSGYPEDSRLSDYAREIQQLRGKRLAKLEQKYQAYREQGALMPNEDGEDLFDVRERIARIDPKYPLLRDASLHKRYFDKVVELSAATDEDHFSRLQKLLEVWRTLFENPAHFQPEDQEQLQRAENRVSLRYLARATELMTLKDHAQAKAFAEYALTLKPVDSVREKLQALIDKATTATPSDAPSEDPETSVHSTQPVAEPATEIAIPSEPEETAPAPSEDPTPPETTEPTETPTPAPLPEQP